MDSQEFKKVFSEIAIRHGFEQSFGALFKESNDCILALILRKSDYSNLYYLRIKVNLRSAFGKSFVKNKEWVKHDIAHIILGVGNQYDDLFDLERLIDDLSRKRKIEELFIKDIIPLTENALSIRGLINSHNKGEVLLVPAIKAELGLN